jgi:hypothetical protein
MALTLTLWLCSVPLVLLLVAPRFGMPATAAAAGGLLVALALVCWQVCARRAPEP